jgi:D-3-phosphoglycerate dehydrogenase
MAVSVYDPGVTTVEAGCDLRTWPEGVEDADFLVITCALTPATRHLVNAGLLARCKRGVRLVNVSRGAIVDERGLAAALEDGHVHSAALDVFETEPLPAGSPLRGHERCVFGSHNASNTAQAVARVSRRAIDILTGLLADAPRRR